MPELPEVETVRQQLHERLAGKLLDQVVIFQSGREQPVGPAFVAGVVGRELQGIERRAKLLIFRFADGGAMLGHLKMTGKFRFVSVNEADSPGKHDRILFVFADGERLMWNDVRKFGYLKLATAAEAEQATAHYGPEPLSASDEVLAECLAAATRRNIKVVLLDQTVIAGIGNIYADESLFRSGIRPMRTAGSLSSSERLRLANEIKLVLAESLAQKGTSAVDYLDTNGSKGSFQNFLQVYGREDEACRVCEQPIIRCVIAQRGTHYCKTCQK